MKKEACITILLAALLVCILTSCSVQKGAGRTHSYSYVKF